MRRDIVVAVRVTEAEAAQIDRRRGSLTRSAWLRLLLLQRTKAEQASLPVGALSGAPGVGRTYAE